MKKKIVFITYNLYNYSGAAFQALKLAQQMQDSFDVCIWDFSNNKIYKKKEQFEGVDIYNCNRDVFSYCNFLFFVLKNRVRIIHFHVFFTPLLLLCAILKKRIVLKTTMISDDDFQTIVSKKRGQILKKYILKSITKNICLSKYAVNLNSKYINKQKIALIPNAVQLPNNITSYKEKEKNSFCSVGVVCERKQTLESIIYFKLQFSLLENARLYIIGPNSERDSVPEFDNEYYLKCKRYITENNLEGKVIFTGKLAKKEVLNYYKNTIAFLFFSKKEGLPNVILEALSYNCVPIVSSIDGVAEEIITKGEDGFIIKNRKESISISDIKNVIKTNNCYNKVKVNYSFNMIIGKYINIYQCIG